MATDKSNYIPAPANALGDAPNGMDPKRAAFQAYQWDPSQYAPTRLQQQLDHYAANWSPTNNAPFAYSPFATNNLPNSYGAGAPPVPALQGRSIFPPINPPQPANIPPVQLNNSVSQMTPEQALAQQILNQQVAAIQGNQTPTLGGAPSAPMMGTGSQTGAFW